MLGLVFPFEPSGLGLWLASLAVRSFTAFMGDGVKLIMADLIAVTNNLRPLNSCEFRGELHVFFPGNFASQLFLGDLGDSIGLTCVHLMGVGVDYCE